MPVEQLANLRDRAACVKECKDIPKEDLLHLEGGTPQGEWIPGVAGGEERPRIVARLEFADLFEDSLRLNSRDAF